MEQVKWVECCVQMERNWPRLRLPPETVEAWFEAFGKRADYPTVQRTLMRLVTEDDKAPGLATIRAAYRDLEGGKHRPPPRSELEDRNDRDRRLRQAVEWGEIHGAMSRYPRLRQVFAALQDQYPDPTDAQGTLVRMAMIDEIKHLTPDEIEASADRTAQSADRTADVAGDPGPREPDAVDVDPFTPVGEAIR